jgi:hypothetical protein
MPVNRDQKLAFLLGRAARRHALLLAAGARSRDRGLAIVEHEPNRSSEGQASLTEIGQFLRAGGKRPEQQVLLALIGTLIDD